jgi:hypothetical protein
MLRDEAMPFTKRRTIRASVAPAPMSRSSAASVRSGGLFKTPTLRNADFNAPYFHDGRFGCAVMNRARCRAIRARVRRSIEVSTAWLEIGRAPVAELIVSHFGFSFGFHIFETRTSCSVTKHAVVNFNF